MRWNLALLFLCAWALVARGQDDTVPATAPRVHLVLELSDGSRIIGTPSIDRLKMISSEADLDIPLSLLGSVEFSGTNRRARANFRNGDLLNGQLAATEIAVKTIFGQAVIPMDQIRRMRVIGGGMVLPDGLVLHYTFDRDEGGRVTDKSGAGNHGEVHGATFTSEGKAGGAMSFNGDKQAIIVGNPVSLRVQDFTIMAWIKRGDLDKATGNDGMDAVLFGYGHAGYIFGIHPNGQLFLSKDDVDNVPARCGVRDQDFHHVAVTKHGNQIVFYLDGAANPAPEYDPGFEFNSDAAVGARADTMGCSFLGVIDEVAVFNRPLSGDEVKEIYDSQK